MARDAVIPSARLTKQPRLLRDTARLSPREPEPPPDGSSHSEQPIRANEDATPTVAELEKDPQGQDASDPSVMPSPDVAPPDAEYEALRSEIFAELEAEHARGAEAARTQAAEQGYAEGYREGEEQGRQEYAEKIEAYSNLIGGARAALESSIGGLADVVVEMTMEATVKILGKSMVSRDGVIAVVRELVDRVSSSTELLIRVSPQDYETLNLERARLLSAVAASQVEIVSDDRIILGGCLLETPSGNLDGRLEIQLQHFRDTLLAAKARWPDPELGDRT